ncbi:MAG: primosomal protein N' [Rikenellaceae bacterium]
MGRYADIVLPLAQGSFTFEVPESLAIDEGGAVVVPFGNSSDKLYTGIVWRIHSQRPNYKRIKSILRTLYSRPLLSSEQRQFWEWIAQYYMCSVGEVMRVALPAMMKPSARSNEEFILEEFKARQEYYIKLVYKEQMDPLLEKLERRAQKQHRALTQIIELSEKIQGAELPRRLLSSDMPTLHAMARKGIISLERKDVTCEQNIHLGEGELFSLPTLTEHQRAALHDIEESFAKRSTTLLHGITGSGKTELYIHLIAKELERGGDVLLLLPEIALTAQLIERMERIFGSRVVAYHSKLTGRKRTEIFLQINNREGGNFIVGVRSAIFLPLRKLNLIIVDEEHDASYKQHDSAPRYNARDAAVAIASMRGGNTLLGSATPSLESWTNGQSGKYGLSQLTERYGEATPPTITISDTIRAVKRGERKGHFNFDLLEKIVERLEHREQTILFQNRRGFAPYVECAACGWNARCPHCNVTLTLHKGAARLSCHYCGYAEQLPAECPECHTHEIKPMGFGTEKIEEQLGELIPTASIARLDRDTVTSPQALANIVESFESGQCDILVGTQMVTKGFDFSKVTLVGILNADNMLNSPDFRAEERAFQLMTQVAGRAGRRGESGEVIIQTSQPQHRVLKLVMTKDYESFARTLLAEREHFSYPPYARIIAITMRDKQRDKLNAAANYLSSLLRGSFGRRLQGPVAPAVDKIRDEYIVEMLLKIESGSSSNRARAILSEKIEAMRAEAEFKYITVICNVDPQ